MTYNLEAYWRKGPYLVGFEYLGTDVDSAVSGDPFFHGYHLSGSWAITGEMRAYRKRSGIFESAPRGPSRSTRVDGVRSKPLSDTRAWI